MDGDPPDLRLLDHTQDAVVVLDEEGSITCANDAADRIFDRERRSLVGASLFEFVHPVDETRVRTALDEITSADRDRSEAIEYRVRRGDGEWRWLRSRLSTAPDLDGAVCSSRDVTARVHAEIERRRTEQRLRELAANTGDVLWMFDGDWERLLFVNRAYEDVYGRPTAELRERPKSFLEAVYPEHRPRVERAMARLSDGHSVEVEYRVNPDRGFRRWVWVRANPIPENGPVERVVGFTRDVTERRRREQQLRVMDTLLRHNLRNDLNVILGQAESVADSLDGDASERLAEIETVGETLLETAEKQRDVIELLMGADRRRCVAVDAVVETVLEEARERHPETSFEASIAAGADAVAIEELPVALAELLDNAVVHDPSGESSVEVDVAVGPEAVTIAVADRGPTIPDEEIRVLTSEWELSDLRHSTGIGLWLVYWVVDLSNGSIEFDTREGGGNRVVVSLPRST